MANKLYAKGAELFLTGGYDWSDNSKSIIILGMSRNYVYDDAHETMGDVSSWISSIIITYISGRSVSGRNAIGSIYYYPGFTSLEKDIHYLIIADYYGSYSTSRLLAYIDDADNLPIIANGGDVYITWPDNIIFTL